MKFIRDNLHDALKLYINQIGIVIFTLALLFPIEALGGEEGVAPVWSILASVLSIIFYYVLIYFVVWEIGAKDKIRVDSGRYEPTPKKGVLLGLMANIPNLIFSLPLFVFTLIYNLSGACSGAYAAFNLLVRFHEAMYLGTVLGFTGFNNDPTSYVQIIVSALFLVVPFVSLLVTHLAYYLGSRDFRVFSFVGKRK